MRKTALDKMIDDAFEKMEASMRWLQENYDHIWNHPILTPAQKAGFLAAVCHPHRCYLATMTLHHRVQAIEKALKK